jgi:hypothetical protein
MTVIQFDDLEVGQEVLVIFTSPGGSGFSQAYGNVTDISEYGDVTLGSHYVFDGREDEDCLFILLSEADEA